MLQGREEPAAWLGRSETKGIDVQATPFNDMRFWKTFVKGKFVKRSWFFCWIPCWKPKCFLVKYFQFSLYLIVVKNCPSKHHGGVILRLRVNLLSNADEGERDVAEWNEGASQNGNTRGPLSLAQSFRKHTSFYDLSWIFVKVNSTFGEGKGFKIQSIFFLTRSYVYHTFVERESPVMRWRNRTRLLQC